MKKLVFVLLLVPGYVLAQQCLLRIAPQSVVELGPPRYELVAPVEIWLADGGGVAGTFKDGAAGILPLTTVPLAVDPAWTKEERDDQLERVCGRYWEQEERRAKARALTDALDGGWSRVVDAG